MAAPDICSDLLAGAGGPIMGNPSIRDVSLRHFRCVSVEPPVL
jgi:hypothetical protein